MAYFSAPTLVFTGITAYTYILAYIYTSATTPLISLSDVVTSLLLSSLSRSVYGVKRSRRGGSNHDYLCDLNVHVCVCSSSFRVIMQESKIQGDGS
jgi:hypothetical protein